MTNAGINEGIVVPFTFFLVLSFPKLTVYLYNFTSLHYKHFFVLYKLVYRVKDEHIGRIICVASSYTSGIYTCISMADDDDDDDHTLNTIR